MASKADKLKAAVARTTVRRNTPAFTPSKTAPKGWRRVNVVLYTDEADWVESMVRDLKRSGLTKANRSVVFRRAVLLLKQQLDGMSPKDAMLDFLENSDAEQNAL